MRIALRFSAKGLPEAVHFGPNRHLWRMALGARNLGYLNANSGDSYVVPFCVVYYSSPIGEQVITKKELHRSLQVCRTCLGSLVGLLYPRGPSMKQNLLWGLKNVDVAYFGLFESAGLVDTYTPDHYD